MELELRKIGNSTGVILPKELLNRLGLAEGDKVFASVEGDRLVLRTDAELFARAMEINREAMKKYREALIELAK